MNFDRMLSKFDREMTERSMTPNAFFSPDMLQNATSTNASTSQQVTMASMMEMKRKLDEIMEPVPPALRGFNPLTCNFSPNPHLGERRQYRFPRSKSKRIRKKWRRNLDNWHFHPSRTFYVLGNTIHGHPTVLDSIKKALSKFAGEKKCTLSFLQGLGLRSQAG